MNATTYSNYDTYTAEKLMERKRKSRKIKKDRQAVVGAVIGSFAMIGIFAGMIAFYIAFGYPLQKVSEKMRIIIGNDIFIVSETENGYNIKSLTSDSTFDVRQGELNASIYRLMNSLGIQKRSGKHENI